MCTAPGILYIDESEPANILNKNLANTSPHKGGVYALNTQTGDTIWKNPRLHQGTIRGLFKNLEEELIKMYAGVTDNRSRQLVDLKYRQSRTVLESFRSHLMHLNGTDYNFLISSNGRHVYVHHISDNINFLRIWNSSLQRLMGRTYDSYQDGQNTFNYWENVRDDFLVPVAVLDGKTGVLFKNFYGVRAMRPAILGNYGEFYLGNTRYDNNGNYVGQFNTQRIHGEAGENRSDRYARFRSTSSDHSSVITIDNDIIIRNDESALVSINISTGRLNWKTGGSVKPNTPIIFRSAIRVEATGLFLGRDNTVYAIGSRKGKEMNEILFALDSRTGKIVGEYPGDGFLRLGQNGNLYYAKDVTPQGTGTAERDVLIWSVQTGRPGSAKSSWPMPGQSPENSYCAPPLGRTMSWGKDKLIQYCLRLNQSLTIQAFGSPDSVKDKTWIYEGMRIVDALNNKYSTLTIQFENDRVKNVEVRAD